MISITVRDVTKRFGQTVAVDGVSLEIGAGELFFLLGPSGCGKTTILRMIAGFGNPDAGEILFDDRVINDVPAHKRNTGLVFQSYALWPHMTVAGNVAYGLEERRIPKDERQRRTGEALRTVRMEPYAERMPNQLSGGQQQRVALARALVIEPDVVLLDEPLSNLDARLRLDMRQEIRRIHDETGITMVYVTHDQKESLSMADRIAVMSMGRLEQVGDPRSVYRRPASGFVADFIGETNMLSGTLASVDAGHGRVDTPLGQFHAGLGPTPLQAGDAVACMVRPESLRLGAHRDNSFVAKVLRSTYLGELEELLLDAAGRQVKLVAANPEAEPPTPGSEVTVHFRPQDAVILPGRSHTTQVTQHPLS